jgi:cyclopropane-fatty-acyl-phospholipid synthase
MTLIDRFLDRAIQRGELTVAFPGGRVATYGRPDAELGHVAIRFADARALRQMLADPSLGTAEAYMDGRLAIERGDIRDFLTLATANNRWEDGRGSLDASRLRRAIDNVRFRIDRVNMARRARRNVAHHYDLSDRLYDLFLDADRQYSCAYFADPGDSLEQAQHAKKAHIAAKLAIEPGMRVLDIGCGWGGMALYLHRTTGAEVCGITLSQEQLKVARRRAEMAGVDAHVRFELVDYRHMTGTFDRIVSVGMFEHVGPAHYRTFFRQCRKLLSPGGVMLLHTIGRAGGPGVTDAFTAKYIFPGGYIPALSEIVRGHEGLRMHCTDIEVLRLHYAHTLAHWYDRVVAHRDAIVAMYDERFYRMWTYYLAGSEVSFRHGGLVNYQLQYARDRHALPMTRDYMVERERELMRPPAPAGRVTA